MTGNNNNIILSFLVLSILFLILGVASLGDTLEISEELAQTLFQIFFWFIVLVFVILLAIENEFVRTFVIFVFCIAILTYAITGIAGTLKCVELREFNYACVNTIAEYSTCLLGEECDITPHENASPAVLEYIKKDIR